MITAVIVDDIKKLSDELKKKVEAHHSDIRVAAVCNSIDDAETALKEIRPDLVFLDVELENGQTSFDLLKKIPDINFEIIFITGFNRYAIQAIRFSAIDYLLKPVDEHELKMAIDKFRAKNLKSSFNKIESFLSAWANPGNQQNRIPLPTMSGYDMVTVADIIYCEGINNQTLFVLMNKKEIFVSMTLKDCEDILTPFRFVRIHKSHLVNLNHVKKYIKVNDGIALMSNDANLNVSRSFKERLIEKMKSPNF